jgi:uncharacterized protein (DUF2345 family)
LEQVALEAGKEAALEAGKEAELAAGKEAAVEAGKEAGAAAARVFCALGAAAGALETAAGPPGLFVSDSLCG